LGDEAGEYRPMKLLKDEERQREIGRASAIFPHPSLIPLLHNFPHLCKLLKVKS
jgi:hypothetical protein